MYDAAVDSVILIPTIYEGGRTAELTISVYCGSAVITATALTGDGAGGGQQQGWELRDMPGLMVDAAYMSGRTDAGARKQSGTVGHAAVTPVGDLSLSGQLGRLGKLG